MKANSLINADELYLVEGDNEITITEATETESGLMSASDKVKLNGIEDGANKTIVDSALSSTSTNPVQNNTINAKFDEIKASIAGKVDIVSGKGLSTNDYTTNEKNKLSGIAVGAEVNQNAFSNVAIGNVTISADSKTDTLNIVAGDNITLVTDATNDKITISSKNTTYNSAGSSLGLVKSGGDVTIASGVITVNDDSHNHIISNIDGLQDQLDSKVNSITGKGLSTNDYTTKEKTKLSGIAEGADVSTIKSISKNGTALSIDSNKNVNIEVPTKVSQLSNDSGYLTEHQNISGKADKATTLSGYGITDAYTQTQVDDKLSAKANKASTLAGYGITDAKISSGTITLGSNSITPVTDISGKQDKITGAATTITSSNLTTNRALISNGSGKVAVSDVTSTQLGYLNSVTGNVQSQLNAKAPLASPALTGTPTAPTADASVNNTQIATTAYVTTAINNVLNASNAMVFKGTIGENGSVTSLPTSHQVGDVYVVSTTGSYAGQNCEVGDMIVCTITGTASKNSDWTVVQSNINGAVTGPSSSVDSHVAIFDGSTGKIVKDSGFTIGKSVPANAVFTDTVYTHPSYTAKTGVPTANQTPSFGGKFTVTQPVSDATGHIVEMNSRTVTIPNTIASASANGLMTSADKTKLDTIAEGAEVNQNAFNKVTVGSTTIEADSKTDTLTIIAGNNVTLTPDATNDKITIASKDTIYKHPSYTARTGVPTANQTPAFGGTFSVSQPVSDKTGHITAINSRTITIPNTAATTSANGLMSSTDKSKLDNIHAKAVNIVVNSSQPSGQVAGDFWYKIL